MGPYGQEVPTHQLWGAEGQSWPGRPVGKRGRPPAKREGKKSQWPPRGMWGTWAILGWAGFCSEIILNFDQNVLFWKPSEIFSIRFHRWIEDKIPRPDFDIFRAILPSLPGQKLVRSWKFLKKKGFFCRKCPKMPKNVPAGHGHRCPKLCLALLQESCRHLL